MGSVPVVFDISSDEEPGPEEFENSNFLDPKVADFNWLSELICEAEDGIDDPDEIMVVGEVNFKKKRSKSKQLNQSSDENDDCVILDGDPDKVVDVVNDSVDDGDELLVVGEKGQIPCRDYPHSRHLCVKFAFSSTPHEQHCALCHCYVCDSIAPCVYWGTGASTIDHCHATDKVEMWKILRKNSQLRKIVPLQEPKVHDRTATTVVVGPLLNKLPSQNMVRLGPNSTVRTSTPRLNGTVNSRTGNQISRSTTIRPCNYMAPSIIRQSRNPPSILDRSRSHHRSFSHYPLGIRNDAIQRDRSLDVSKLSSQFISSSMMCKRKVASRSNSVANRAIPHNSNDSRVSQYNASPVTTAAALPPLTGSNAIGSSCWQDLLQEVDKGLYNHQGSLHLNLNNVVTSTMSSEVQISHQHTLQSNDSESFYQNQNQQGDQNINQPGDFNLSASQNDFLLETQGENGMFQAETNGLSAGEHSFHLPIDSTTGSSDVNINWVNDQTQENSQFLTENCQYRCVGSTHESFPGKETTSHFTREFNDNPLHGGSFENWPFENQTVPLVSDCSVPFEPNMLPVESTAIDAGLLVFDFETSWNGLTQT